jgi:hypothetical protein
MGSVNDLFVTNDAFDSILLGVFFFGLVFSTISLALGAADAGIGHGHGDLGSHLPGHDGGDVSPFSVGSLLAFVTWFGGVAYLARNALDLPLLLALAIGAAAGWGGGWLIYRALRALRAGGASGAPRRVTGSYGRVTAAIRPGGTGEIISETGGVRQVSPARSLNGNAIPVGAEIVVLRREAGIAYVETWGDVLEHDTPSVTVTELPAEPPPLAPRASSENG